VSLSLKARHEGCVGQAELRAVMAAESLANASIAGAALGGAGTSLTRNDVIDTMGDIDEVTVADIIARR